MTEFFKRMLRLCINHVIRSDLFVFSHKGFCPCCDHEVRFISFDSWLRDNFHCSNCGSIPRERALMHTLEKYYPEWRRLKIHESSPGNRGASLKLKEECHDYIATQFYENEEPGAIVNDFRNENLENQSFEDETIDLVITQDVFEHVYNPEAAFREIYRTLKKGGAHIFTVPLVNKHKSTEVWAVKSEDSKPHFLIEPEFHGNPIDPQGSPVTMHWGYDIVKFIQNSCGMNTEIVYIDDLNYGIRAEFNEVLISKRSAD